MALLKVSQSIEYDHGYSNNGSSQTTNHNVFRMLTTLEPSIMRKLVEKFRLDSELFGYPLPAFETASTETIVYN